MFRNSRSPPLTYNERILLALFLAWVAGFGTCGILTIFCK